MPRIVTSTGRGALLLALALAIFMPQTASGLSLADLIDGGELWSDDGNLHLDGFGASVLDPIGESDNSFVDLDLALVDLELVSTGVSHVLQITGPFDASPDEFAQIRIHYDVTAGDGVGIVQLALRMQAETTEWGEVEVIQSVSGDHDDRLFASIGYGPSELGDTSETDPGTASLHVETDLFLSGARVGRIDQDFEVRGPSAAVPEPGSALLFGAGLIVAARRCRRTDR